MNSLSVRFWPKAVARELKIRPNSVSRYREGIKQFGPKTAMKIATILDISPENIAADMMAARAKYNKRLMKKWIERGALISLIFGAIVLSPITTNVAQAMESIDKLHTMRICH